MINNRASIFAKAIPIGLACKLGLLLSIILTVFPNYLFASENPPTEVTVSKESSPEQDPEQNAIITITEGTVIYGMENTTAGVEIITPEPKSNAPKSISKKVKSEKIVEKAIAVVEKEYKIEPIKVNINYNSTESTSFFHNSTQSSSVGTLSLKTSTSFAVLKEFSKITLPLTKDIHGISEYADSLISSKADFYSFTRPPPFS